MKRRLLLGTKVMTNLDSILKSRDTTLPTKIHLVKAMVFPVVCMDVRVGPQRKLNTEELMLFELWCWRSLLRVPWTERRSNRKPILIFTGRTNTEAPILWPPNVKSSLIRKDPDAGKD